MGLDIYSGSLARYYCRDFKTPAQLISERAGFELETVFEQENPFFSDAETSQAAIMAMKADLAERFSDQAPDIASWNDDCPDQLVLQLHQECRDALLLLVAYAYRPELTRPSQMPRQIDHDPALAEANDRGYYMGPLAILECQMYIPFDSGLLLATEDPIKQQIVATSVANLKGALTAVEARYWPDGSDIEAWFDSGPQPRPNEVVWTISPDGSRSEEKPEYSEDEVLRNGQYAFSVLSKIATFAHDNKTAVRLDF